jgi:hypothetical protein
MEVNKIKETQIVLKGDDIDNFKSGLKKIVEEQKQAGFKKGSMTEQELKLFKDIQDKI